MRAENGVIGVDLARPRRQAWPSEASPVTEWTLPPNEFLRDLQKEKRRSERTASPLSLIAYRIADQPALTDRLIEALHTMKRDTDVVGYVGHDTIAVLCPDTDQQGAACFLRKIEGQLADAKPAALAATYPDNLFESISQQASSGHALRPLLTSDSSAPADAEPYKLKRSLDIVGALLAIAVLWPLMLIVAMAVATTSRGPVIFKQTRIGKGGEPFTFYKFRSMACDADDDIHRSFVAELIRGGASRDEGAPPTRAPFKLHADPRVTRVGRFIRRTSMDELPQLFNVLKGNMSLVGPRPPIPYEASHYQTWHLRRLLGIKPGITGLWQVEGRSKVSFNDMVRLDLRYIRECSLALDLKILFKTILVVCRCDGAV